MKPDRVISPYVPRIPKTPAAIRAALAAELRADFDAEYWPALAADEQAHGRKRAVPAVVARWWPEAVSCAQPEGRAARLAAEAALAAGHPVPTVPGED